MHQKYLKLCSEDEQSFYGFRTTVINDKMFMLGCSKKPFKEMCLFKTIASAMFVNVSVYFYKYIFQFYCHNRGGLFDPLLIFYVCPLTKK